jgi:ABC-type cobalamin/Fe3+-siderophores transport system ATPase subunit
MNPRIAIQSQELSFRFESGHVLTNVSFSVPAGELVALIGPNGSGKTTLLRLLLGHVLPSAGHVLLYNQRLHSYAPRELAKTVAYVSQQTALSFPLTVFELVSLGRFPHGARFKFLKSDSLAVERALDATHSIHLKDRNFTTLSGGEQQKVLISRALAQSARILLLDEPTLHLDLFHQLQILAALKRLCVEEQITVLTVLHDVNLVSLFADKALLLGSGQLHGFGPIAEVINENNLRQLLGVDMKATEDAETGFRFFIPRNPFSSMRQ